MPESTGEQQSQPSPSNEDLFFEALERDVLSHGGPAYSSFAPLDETPGGEGESGDAAAVPADDAPIADGESAPPVAAAPAAAPVAEPVAVGDGAPGVEDDTTPAPAPPAQPAAVAEPPASPPPASPAPAPADQPAFDDDIARKAAREFLGLTPPVDEDNKPTGEEPEFTRLDREARSKNGIRYEDDQARYAELAERNAMAGKLFTLARQMTWDQVGADLVDAELGLDEEAVRRAGSVPAWKAEFKKATEARIASQYAGQNQAAIDAARAETARVSAEYEAKLADASRRLEEQAAQHRNELLHARGVRAPVVSGGRPASRPDAVAVPAGATASDLTSALAGWFREEEAGR